jgi:hypothetical protein
VGSCLSLLSLREGLTPEGGPGAAVIGGPRWAAPSDEGASTPRAPTCQDLFYEGSPFFSSEPLLSRFPMYRAAFESAAEAQDPACTPNVSARSAGHVSASHVSASHVSSGRVLVPSWCHAQSAREGSRPDRGQARSPPSRARTHSLLLRGRRTSTTRPSERNTSIGIERPLYSLAIVKP